MLQPTFASQPNTRKGPVLGFAVLGLEQSTGLFNILQMARHTKPLTLMLRRISSLARNQN